MLQKRYSLLMTAICATVVSHNAAAQVPVIDEKNYKIANQTSQTTDKILNTNKEILKSVEETLKAVTGNRGSDAGQMQNLAIGNGFSVSSVPSIDKVMSGGMPNFGQMGGNIAQIATTFINGLKLVKSLTGKTDSDFSGDRSYEQMVSTVMAVSALINGSQQAVTQRRSAFEQAGQNIGQAEDIKGSIDQNTQLQVQSGLTINELVGVMNGAVSSLQAQTQKQITDMSNTNKILQYGEGK